MKALSTAFVKSNLILYPFFCLLSFFTLYSNVRWRKVLKRTMMHLHFTFLILSKYDSPIRWALPRLEPRISKFDSAQISLTFSRTSMEVSLSTDGTPSILKQSLRLYCSVSLQEAAMALFCFFLICLFVPEGDFYLDYVGESYLLWIFQRYHCLMLL